MLSTWLVTETAQLMGCCYCWKHRPTVHKPTHIVTHRRPHSLCPFGVRRASERGLPEGRGLWASQSGIWERTLGISEWHLGPLVPVLPPASTHGPRAPWNTPALRCGCTRILHPHRVQPVPPRPGSAVTCSAVGAICQHLSCPSLAWGS